MKLHREKIRDLRATTLLFAAIAPWTCSIEMSVFGYARSAYASASGPPAASPPAPSPSRSAKCALFDLATATPAGVAAERGDLPDEQRERCGHGPQHESSDQPSPPQ
jgi:hypothetical protein